MLRNTSAHTQELVFEDSAVDSSGRLSRNYLHVKVCYKNMHAHGQNQNKQFYKATWKITSSRPLSLLSPETTSFLCILPKSTQTQHVCDVCPRTPMHAKPPCVGSPPFPTQMAANCFSAHVLLSCYLTYRRRSGGIIQGPAPFFWWHNIRRLII